MHPREPYAKNRVITFYLRSGSQIVGFGKHYFPAGMELPLGPMRVLSRDSIVEHALQTVEQLTPVAQTPRVLFHSESTLIWEFLNCPSLAELYKNNPSKHYEYIRVAIRSFRKIAETGFYHFDPNWGNLLVRSYDDIIYIDFDRVCVPEEGLDLDLFAATLCIDQLFRDRQLKYKTVSQIKEIAEIMCEEYDRTFLDRLIADLPQIERSYLHLSSTHSLTRDCILLCK